jgi:RNA polymerase sigma-70 factor (ECF subfamily)
MTLDKDTLKNLQAGDVQALDQLIVQELPSIYNFAYRLTRRDAEAEELTKQTFAQSQREMKNMRVGSNLSSRLLAITIDLWKDKQKTAKRASNKPHRTGGSTLEEEYTPRQRHILNVIERLTPDEKILLILSDAEGKSYAEVNGILKLSASTVRTRLSRARDHLRSLSEQLGGVA